MPTGEKTSADAFCFRAKAGALATGRPPRRRSRRIRLRFRFGRSGQSRCRRAAFYTPISARPAVNCAVRADKRQCAAVDAADGAFEPSVNANRHFGSSGAAQRDKADRQFGRHRLCLPKRNERRFASAPASVSAAQMRKASKTIKVQNRKPVSFIRLHDHSFCAAKAFFCKAFMRSAALSYGVCGAPRLAVVRKIRFSIGRRTGTDERLERSFHPIFPLCAVFCAKKENRFREIRNRHAADQITSTALPHTKNCRSEYRSGNSVFCF